MPAKGPDLGANSPGPYEYHWSGLVALTRDHLPRLQEVAPGLLAGFGYNGRGVAMATMRGALLARWSSVNSAAGCLRGRRRVLLTRIDTL